MNTTTDNNLRFAAEWEPHGAVMLSWPHSATDWNYMLDEVRQCYRNIIDALVASGSRVVILSPKEEAPEFDSELITVIHVDTNDTWIRDYGPLTLRDAQGNARLLDFRFNAWGQKFASNFDNQTTRSLKSMKAIGAEVECHKDFVLEGGSIESDGAGTILTTECCLMAPNRNEPMTRAEVEAQLLNRLHARMVLWLRHGALTGDDTDGHVDTISRLAPGNTILYTACHDRLDEHYETLEAMRRELTEMTNADGEAFNLIELPLPEPVYDPEDGSRLPATYANYLVTDRAILMPTYNQPLNDRLAADTLRVAYPDHEVITVDCLALVRQHGSLHCATMQVPTEIFSFL